MAYHRFIIFACVLAFAVILLGAYTRLADAGLGCPDWPGCYGHLTVPSSEAAVADKAYLEQRPLEVAKGWKEMVHRYFAGTLGLVILAITIWSWVRRRKPLLLRMLFENRVAARVRELVDRAQIPYGTKRDVVAITSSGRTPARSSIATVSGAGVSPARRSSVSSPQATSRATAGACSPRRWNWTRSATA